MIIQWKCKLCHQKLVEECLKQCYLLCPKLEITQMPITNCVISMRGNIVNNKEEQTVYTCKIWQISHIMLNKTRHKNYILYNSIISSSRKGRTEL